MYREVTVLKNDNGFSMLEGMVAIAVFGIVSLGFAYNAITAYQTVKLSVRYSIASQLALEKLESLQAIDPATLDESDNSAENELIQNNIEFSRTVDIVVNPDESRTVTVNVQVENSNLGGSVSFSHTFPLWGNT